MLCAFRSRPRTSSAFSFIDRFSLARRRGDKSLRNIGCGIRVRIEHINRDPETLAAELERSITPQERSEWEKGAIEDYRGLGLGGALAHSVSYDTIEGGMRRPSHAEVLGKIRKARQKVAAKDWLAADIGKLLPEFHDLDRWTVEEQTEALAAALGEARPEHYAGSRPPQRPTRGPARARSSLRSSGSPRVFAGGCT